MGSQPEADSQALAMTNYGIKKKENRKKEKMVYSKEGTTVSGHVKEDILYWRVGWVKETKYKN